MPRNFVLLFCVLLFGLISCQRKTVPTTSASTSATVDGVTVSTTGKDTVASKPIVVRKRIKTPVPKSIVVNDASAKRAVDGRYYYDLEGKRYWRNKKDGRYYLFNKSMSGDDAFKP